MTDDYSDDNAWLEEISDVSPLKSNPKKSTQLLKEPVQNFDKPASKKNVPSSPQTQPFTPPSSVSAIKVNILENTASCLAGTAEGLEPGLLQKLKRGQISFTHRLDLHGFYEADAWRALMDYLHEAVQKQHRCVLIIHGKGRGYGANSDMGIIKSQIAGWLTTHPKVLAFHTALPKDGGAGALYVYLRRSL